MSLLSMKAKTHYIIDWIKNHVSEEFDEGVSYIFYFKESLFEEDFQLLSDYILTLPIDSQPKPGDIVRAIRQEQLVYERSPRGNIRYLRMFWSGSNLTRADHTEHQPFEYLVLIDYPPDFWKHQQIEKIYIEPWILSDFTFRRVIFRDRETQEFCFTLPNIMKNNKRSPEPREWIGIAIWDIYRTFQLERLARNSDPFHRPISSLEVISKSEGSLPTKSAMIPLRPFSLGELMSQPISLEERFKTAISSNNYEASHSDIFPYMRRVIREESEPTIENLRNQTNIFICFW